METTHRNMWHVHCPVCGAHLIRSSVSDSEVECKKCHHTIGVLVKDGMVSVCEKHGEEMKGRAVVYRGKLGTALKNR